MSKIYQKQKANDKVVEAFSTLMEFCINEKIINPKITMDAKTTDGEYYVEAVGDVPLQRTKIIHALFCGILPTACYRIVVLKISGGKIKS